MTEEVKIRTAIFHFDTEGHNDILNITPKVQSIVEESGLQEGSATVFAIGSTGGITTLEFEPGLVNHDVEAMMEKIAPYASPYHHNQTWGDDNGAAHLRSFLTGTSYVVPFVDGKLLLGTWQQIVFVDFDTRPRRRKVAIQITGF